MDSTRPSEEIFSTMISFIEKEEKGKEYGDDESGGKKGTERKRKDFFVYFLGIWLIYS